jgi:hypothetical protein
LIGRFIQWKFFFTDCFFACPFGAALIAMTFTGQ